MGGRGEPRAGTDDPTGGSMSNDERTPENGWTLRVWRYLFESEGRVLEPPDFTEAEAMAAFEGLRERCARQASKSGDDETLQILRRCDRL